MKYTAKGKQNIEGVQTLTHDPLATYQVVGKGKPISGTTKRK